MIIIMTGQVQTKKIKTVTAILDIQPPFFIYYYLAPNLEDGFEAPGRGKHQQDLPLLILSVMRFMRLTKIIQIMDKLKKNQPTL